MRITPLRLALSLVLLGLALASSTKAQEPIKRVASFEPDRAILDLGGAFDPFRVTSWESLAEAREQGKVGDETRVLVLARGDARLALLTNQMAYHHLAQGELGGEPWMVSF